MVPRARAAQPSAAGRPLAQGIMCASLVLLHIALSGRCVRVYACHAAMGMIPYQASDARVIHTYIRHAVCMQKCGWRGRRRTINESTRPQNLPFSGRPGSR